MNSFNVVSFRKQFPLLDTKVNKQQLVYFDNAATTQKPFSVINKTAEYYSRLNANVHRASHALSAQTTQEFEQAREKVRVLLNAKTIEEIIWTKGTTESINLIAQSWGRTFLKTGDEIVLSQCEHHANIVPWQIVAQQTGAVIKVLPLTKNGTIDESSLDTMITSATKIVSCAHISNVLGRRNPLEKIIAQAKKHNALTIIDGAQAIAHQSVNVQALGCDFYVFSAHKMYGPTGVGILYGRLSLLEQMPPYQGGGEMIKSVSFSGTHYNALPFKFEAGTPNIAGIIAFSSAISFFQNQCRQELENYERGLVDYCLKAILTLPSVKTIVEGKPDIPIISFTVDGHHNHDIASSLDSFGIAVRSGHHCAMPLMEYLKITGCIRISLAPYNTIDEIDFFIQKLKFILKSQEVHGIKILEESQESMDRFSFCSKSIVDLFSSIKGWDNRHRQIMLLGKELVRMPKNQQTEQNVIKGCESLAWLTYSIDLQGYYIFSADSNAKVIRGLLVIVLAAFNNKNAQQIKDFNIENYFNQLGLIQHLSPSRSNGVRAIVEKIISLIE